MLFMFTHTEMPTFGPNSIWQQHTSIIGKMYIPLYGFSRISILKCSKVLEDNLTHQLNEFVETNFATGSYN